jgi:hypothetical protein
MHAADKQNDFTEHGKEQEDTFHVMIALPTSKPAMEIVCGEQGGSLLTADAAGFRGNRLEDTSCGASDFFVSGSQIGRALHTIRPGKTLNSAAGLPARVRIPVPPSATSRLLYQLLDRMRRATNYSDQKAN